MNSSKLWTGNFLIIILGNFFVYFTYYLLISIIAVYVTDKFNASPSMAGLVAGIFVLGAILGRLFAGNKIEKIGYKKMLYLSFAFYLFTTLLYFIVHSLGILLIIRLLHGAAFGLTSTATGTIAAEIIPNKRRGEGTGYYALSTTMAAAIGPFFGMFLMNHANFNVNLIICSIAIGVSFIATFPLTIPKENMAVKEKLTVKEKDVTKKFALKNFVEAKAIPISIVTALACFGYSSILSFISSYAKDINLAGAGSFFFIVYAIAILVSRPLTGRLFDVKGENIIILPTLILFSATLVLLSQVTTGFMILLAGAFMGLSYGNFFASGQALAIKVSPQNRKALATSTYFIFADLGAGIGPFVFGFTIPILGFRGLYISMAVLVFAAAILYYFIHGRKNKK